MVSDSKELENGRQYIVCIVAEGVHNTSELVDWLEHDVGIETRATILGHIQRGGNPTVFDRLMASEFTIYAVDHLLDNKTAANVIVYNNSKFEFVTIEYVNSSKYQIKQELLDLASRGMN